ncbi:MAG TPA: ABC transporter substrate-binding protein, partial [Anaerolineae bacterium]|nr:ABC transporter substrate-binding protein [Anaerolineae bacterium]
IDQGVIVQQAGGWRATAEIAQVEIPATLQGVLLARIDRLQEDVRRTLQLASVIGRTFLYRLLEAISAAERQLDEHLSQLQRADLVREKTRRPELEYIFKHSLTQEAAYSSLLVERRREFHRKVGEALEQLFAERQEEFYGLLAHHFEAAGDPVKAIEYLGRAGDAARHNDAFEEAIQYYQREIALLDQQGDAAHASKTWLKLGLIHQVNFRFEQAHQANETAFALERRVHAVQGRVAGGPAHPGQPRVLRLCSRWHPSTLDPSRVSAQEEFCFSSHLFAGLAELDAAANVVPHVARSWEVLEGGRRYVFHLRDDVYWTDGSPVTAEDFEWAWKRHLEPAFHAAEPCAMDDIVGARPYREGRNPDPQSVGVRALDAHTLEARLDHPVAYFIYLAAMPGAWPLPRAVVERWGGDWWRPEHIVCNGPFRLVEFDEAHLRMERNPGYFGEFGGNLDQFLWKHVGSPAAGIREYLDGQADHVASILPGDVAPEIPASQIVEKHAAFTGGLVLFPSRPPMDDVRFRRAIAHAIDGGRLAAARGLKADRTSGGILPPGLAGHSPELGLPFDPEQARQLLAEAGYSKGNRPRRLNLHFPTWAAKSQSRLVEELERQMLEHLGLQLDLELIPEGVQWGEIREIDMLLGGWLMDYPDPDNFLRQSFFYTIPWTRGWRDARLEQLLEQAARTADRLRRLDMYRQADRILVNEEAVAVPIFYVQFGPVDVVKPWVKGLRYDLMSNYRLNNIVLEPH